jgi:hypothetical protein
MAGRDSLFDSAWLKWGKAIDHARILREAIDAESTTNGDADPLVSVRTEYYPLRHGFGVYAAEVRGVPTEWGLVTGDVANNYRCALDHLAWALVSRGRNPPATLNDEQQSAVGFPVTRKRRQFNNSLDRRLPGVQRSDRAKVRAVQPYHQRRRASRHNLVILTGLNNRDKHRSIEPVWIHTTKLEITITDRRDCINPRARSWTPGQLLESGAEVAFIRVRKTGSQPRLGVQTRLTGVPAILPRIGLIEWFEQTGLQIGVLLGEFSEAPDEVAEAAAWLMK